MPKHAKTRKQKELIDLRRKTVINSPKLHHFELAKQTAEIKLQPAIPLKIPRTETASISGIDYQYLRSDLLRTIFLTAAIAITQLIIYFFIFKA